jgi:hypothetical protein
MGHHGTVTGRKSFASRLKGLGFMKNIVRLTLLAVIGITVLLAVCGWKFVHHITFPPPSSAQLAIYKFDLDIFKTVLASFLVAMLGILIPASITEARHNFKRLKESRDAYSRAKTGLDYLALRLCNVKLAEAPDIIQEVHFYKHQAVLYPEFEQHIRDRYASCITSEVWDNVAYRKLRNTRILLKRNASEWDDLTPAERLGILRVALPDIDEVHQPRQLLEYSLVLDDHGE